MTQQGKYIYGIIEETQARKFDFPGIEDAEVYAINYQRLAAVVSDIELKELDPTRKNVLAHTVVQDKLLKEYDLLPMGFGMMADNEEAVQKLLVKNYEGLVTELKRLSGKIEAELKVFWDQEAIMKELESETRELSRIKERIKVASSPIEMQNLLVESGKLVEQVAMTWKTKYGQRAYNRLKELSLDACENNTVGVKNILNASFLIDRSKEGEFQEELKKLDFEYRGKVNFKYVGPLAPYNFVKLKLESVQ